MGWAGHKLAKNRAGMMNTLWELESQHNSRPVGRLDTQHRVTHPKSCHLSITQTSKPCKATMVFACSRQHNTRTLGVQLFRQTPQSLTPVTIWEISRNIYRCLFYQFFLVKYINWQNLKKKCYQLLLADYEKIF